MSNKYKDIANHICKEIEELLKASDSAHEIGWEGRALMASIYQKVSVFKTYLIGKKAVEESNRNLSEYANSLGRKLIEIDTMIVDVQKKIRCIG